MRSEHNQQVLELKYEISKHLQDEQLENAIKCIDNYPGFFFHVLENLPENVRLEIAKKFVTSNPENLDNIYLQGTSLKFFMEQLP